MRYRCLIFDHDDTTVDSTRNVHYPCFTEFMRIHRPQLDISLDEYVRYNFAPGVIPFFRDICGLDEAELAYEQNYWLEYARKHVSPAFEGIRDIMLRQKAEGGLVTVISHSFAENILKDYAHNGLPDPDAIFGWEQPPEERKPSPVPVRALMQRYGLKPEEILVIDDLKPGLDMARSAGVSFAAAGWCFDIPENESYLRENADFYCASVKELETVCFG